MHLEGLYPDPVRADTKGICKGVEASCGRLIGQLEIFEEAWLLRLDAGEFSRLLQLMTHRLGII